jgi:hypothetical protein
MWAIPTELYYPLIFLLQGVVQYFVCEYDPPGNYDNEYEYASVKYLAHPLLTIIIYKSERRCLITCSAITLVRVRSAPSLPP